VIVNLDVDTHKNREKVLRRLLTKGFTYNIAKQAISAKRGDMKEEVHTIAALDDVIF
jgi:SOS response regulatory protein OraA/RecX